MIEDVLEGLHGVRPLRVAMGATTPIGEIFRRVLSIETVYFARPGRARRAAFCYSTVTSSSISRPSGFW